MKPTVVVHPETKVVERVLVDGAPVEFELADSTPETQVPPTVVLEFTQRLDTTRNKRVLHVLGACTPSRVLAVVPWHSVAVPPGCAFLTGAAYVLRADSVPEPKTFFPLNWSYASGYAMVEVDPVIEDSTGALLSSEYFQTPHFKSRLTAFDAECRGENRFEHLPGWVLADTVKTFARFSHVRGTLDPLLTVYKPDFMRDCMLRLQKSDFVGVYASDWSQVSLETKQSAGHNDGTRHFYAVVKYALPEECSEQLKYFVYSNPNKDAWAKLISRKPFERARATAVGVREQLLKKFLAHTGLRAKRSNPHVVDTPCDVFDPLLVHVGSADGAEFKGVVFYAGCAPTHRADRGLLTEISDDPGDGLLWLHGTPSSRVGGDGWKQARSVNSLPVFSCTKVTKKVLDTYAAAGWARSNGYATLKPVVLA